MTNAHAARSVMVSALDADLVGPFPGVEQEILPLPPSRWYLTGFLAPLDNRLLDDPTGDDELLGGDEDDGDDNASPEPDPKLRRRLAASIGLSVFLPAGNAKDVVTVHVAYGDYVAIPDTPSEDAKKRGGRQGVRWRREKPTNAAVTVALDPEVLRKGVEIPGTRGLKLVGQLKDAAVTSLPAGTRALALFLVNAREKGARGKEDEQFVFQVRMELRYAGGLVARPNRRDDDAMDKLDWDERVADLQFRHAVEYAVGHGVAAEPIVEGAKTVGAQTRWLPTATVHRVETHNVDGVERSMDALAALPDGASTRKALLPVVDAYGQWIASQAALDVGTAKRKETQQQLMKRAEHARQRISAGIELLATVPDVLDSFRRMNRAMADAARARKPTEYVDGRGPEWRLFQLAFVLLNIAGIHDEQHPDRQTVELIFFPTGGGKTEAYLGVIAFTLFLRRLRRAGRPDKGLGVTVLLRYTLRLLTLDQLGRAATLMCAMELQRREDQAHLGPNRFAVGLWVGRTATANTFQEVARRVTEYKNSTSKTAPSPCPMGSCPWCRRPLEKDSLELRPNKTDPTEVVIGCADYKCPFSKGNRDFPEGIPVLFVDEHIYQELPAFIIATVDKFAMLPWRGEAGMLFGKVAARSGRTFYGPMAHGGPPMGVELLPDGLLPPALIVQDELHLISGPLGTMVGLYETAVEYLCTVKKPDGNVTAPKIIAATATVRRAGQQIQALFGRHSHALFPPPGVDDSETFFAKVDKVSAGRLYIGLAASGRAMKGILLRAYVSLLGSGQLAAGSAGKDAAADPYLTLVGYFNSLRELGGMRRLVEDEVRSRALQNERRRPDNVTGPHPLFRNRELLEPLELTSRESLARIATARARLELSHATKEHVDVLLSSNMISVGVDIDRLGLMVVAGQPKTTAEYIQATSRVGRDHKRPGLVVTVLNIAKPRDRSHYERFSAYHASFYRNVEATSVTPFSGPALERGLAGALVAMVRHSAPVMTAANAVKDLAKNREVGDAAAAKLSQRVGQQPKPSQDGQQSVMETLKKRGLNLLDSWEQVILQAEEGAAERRYSPFDKKSSGKALLFTVLDENKPVPGTDEAKFAAATSMRDVEPSVHLWVERKPNLAAEQKGKSNG